MDWVNKKIVPKMKGKKNENTKRQIAESIAKHITLHGPRPFPFIKMTLEKDLPILLKRHGLTSTVNPNKY